MTYDALDNDIALLNVYFGESSVMGEYEATEDSISNIQSMSGP